MPMWLLITEKVLKYVGFASTIGVAAIGIIRETKTPIEK